MSLAQKFRGFISSKATVATLTGVLAVLPLFNGNAQAQEPFKTSHHPSTPNITEQYKPSIITQASDYAETNKAVSIIVFKGRKDEGGYTGQDIANKVAKYFSDRGIPTKAFVADSPNDYSTVGFAVKDYLSNPSSLGKVPAAVVSAAHTYVQAYGAAPEVIKGYGVTAASPSLHQE
ncbi:MAG: hypothetical protein DYH13_10965 [Alphaproteobacteria bacterium PRO2]|nr:hypothetical protein [Alphaproteobacteria bacterium PRO2]